MDLRRALWFVGEMVRNDVLALFPPKQSVSINHLQLNVPMGGRIEEMRKRGSILALRTVRGSLVMEQTGLARHAVYHRTESRGKMHGSRGVWWGDGGHGVHVKVGSDKRCEP